MQILKKDQPTPCIGVHGDWKIFRRWPLSIDSRARVWGWALTVALACCPSCERLRAPELTHRGRPLSGRVTGCCVSSARVRQGLSGKRAHLAVFPTTFRSDPEGAAAAGKHLIVAWSSCLLSMVFTCARHQSFPRPVLKLPTQGGSYRLCVPCWCFPKMSNPTAVWNSSISFLSRYQAESESSLSGALVTEGKCIKEVKNMSGWSAAKGPAPSPHLVPNQKAAWSQKAPVWCLCLPGDLAASSVTCSGKRQGFREGRGEQGSEEEKLSAQSPDPGSERRYSKVPCRA